MESLIVSIRSRRQRIYRRREALNQLPVYRSHAIARRLDRRQDIVQGRQAMLVHTGVPLAWLSLDGHADFRLKPRQMTHMYPTECIRLAQASMLN